MEIGPVIRRLRKARGMTLEALAFAAQSDAGNLSRLERGQGRLTLDGLEQIARALGTTAVAMCQAAEQGGGQAMPIQWLDERLYQDFDKLGKADKELLREFAAMLARRSGRGPEQGG